MKKLLAILLLVMYGTSSFGMSVHFHYCCGKLESIDLAVSNTKKCGNGNDHQMGSVPCCNEKKVDIKLAGEQNPAKTFELSFQPAALKPVPQQPFQEITRESQMPPAKGTDPPPLSHTPLFILLCVFRI